MSLPASPAASLPATGPSAPRPDEGGQDGATPAWPARARDAVLALPGSKLRAIANRAMGRDDVLAFWFGEASRMTDPRIREAASRSLASGETFYSPNLGIADLRTDIASYTRQLHGAAAPAISERRIAVTSSGVSALMLAMQTQVGPGDRVVAVTPLWPNLTAIPTLLGAQLTSVPLQVREGRWWLDLDRLLVELTAGTRLLILNSPANPTGWVITPAQIEAIRSHCRRLGIWVLADEAYERLAFDRDRAPSFLDGSADDDRLIIANTFSKTWCMTGFRIGWLTLPEGLVPDLEKLVEFNTSCAPVFVQRAAQAALATGEAPIRELRDLVTTGTRALAARLAALPGVTVVEPEGAMYLMLAVAGEHDSVALASRLVDEAALGLAPGSAFGPETEGWLRWCTARPVAELLEGADRLARYLR